MTDIDPWMLYTETRDRLIALVRPLGPEQTSLPVPLTPGWTIAEVVAHVCGLNADVAAGLREGLGSDERTAHQVATRAGQSVAAVCDEWLSHANGMSEAIEQDGFFGLRLSADLVVHLHDIQHGLGEMIDRDDAASISGGRTYAARTPDRLIGPTGVSLIIELSDGSRYQPTGEPGEPISASAESAQTAESALVLRTTPYDFLRSVTGRRSRREVEALDWSGDPTPLLEQFCPYGPLRTVDAGV